ncbi:hypothetical protein BO86DRAFT_401095 [Aspergillus japonicus CBS 114.51]|uniref:Uncharacterized protein n=1 Tax=Aspergillus japonicus CBS 114.51 TaxID=1448312 RepID=A0A8T8WW70_ASPJA|nr:hypothetical protein BO86DRAFT_401095 [Aspergillus japonicus CBS 114.51]RAH80097.1 hypothetical protein BO86DRAFT_401095 [Aspergillus japonicus CBS 114.51]
MDGWRLEKQLGPAPKALDPTCTGHRTTGDLLDGSKSGNLQLMTGFVLRAPKPQMEPEKKYFPEAAESSGDWLPGVRKDGSTQWVDVHDTSRGDKITEQEPAVADAEHEPSSGPTAVQFVAKWEELMRWEREALSRCATMTVQMNERFMHLLADASSISVRGLSDGESEILLRSRVGLLG